MRREAGRLGLKSGDYVRLRNQDGQMSNRIQVKATERIRPDCVYHGAWLRPHLQGTSLRFRQRRERLQLITRYKTDPLMGGTGMNVNFVTIETEA